MLAVEVPEALLITLVPLAAGLVAWTVTLLLKVTLLVGRHDERLDGLDRRVNNHSDRLDWMGDASQPPRRRRTDK